MNLLQMLAELQRAGATILTGKRVTTEKDFGVDSRGGQSARWKLPLKAVSFRRLRQVKERSTDAIAAPRPRVKGQSEEKLVRV